MLGGFSFNWKSMKGQSFDWKSKWDEEEIGFALKTSRDSSTELHWAPVGSTELQLRGAGPSVLRFMAWLGWQEGGNWKHSTNNYHEIFHDYSLLEQIIWLFLSTLNENGDFQNSNLVLRFCSRSQNLIFWIFSELIMLVSCNTPLNVAWW